MVSFLDGTGLIGRLTSASDEKKLLNRIDLTRKYLQVGDIRKILAATKKDAD